MPLGLGGELRDGGRADRAHLEHDRARAQRVEETALDEHRARRLPVRHHRHDDVGVGEPRGLSGALAPASTSGAQRSAVRFQTTSGKPAASTLRAIARPIRPIPANPTVTVVTRW